MMCRLFFYLWLFVCVNSQNDRESILVKTAQGPVRGYKDPEGGLYAFYGIPYATAPTGKHRFSAPLPPPFWLQPFDAIDKEIICPQVEFPNFLLNKTKQEDCLIANVFVPDTNEANLSVLVYIHGGAFQLGFGELIPPKSLVRRKNVIAVDFNYRLGAHGFLCLGTKDVPGNAGMKDQVALLRWVQKNIASFGGNPDDVTIAGYSAGSTSVDLLMLSDMARGLFHKVIPESGASLGPYAIQLDPLQTAKNFASKLKFENVNDIYALEEFYKTVPLELLLSDAFMDNANSSFMFSPCIERNNEPNTFLSETPMNILKSGKYAKLPLLYGFADMEGLLRLDFFDYWKNLMNERFSDFLPADLEFASENDKEEVAKSVKEFYFGDQPVSEANILEYVNFFSDVIFAYPMLKAVRLHIAAGHDKVYLYEYSYVDETTPVVPHTNVRGANHVAQTAAVLDSLLPNAGEKTESFVQMKNVLQELWLNFVTTGSPVVEGSELPPWPPVVEGSSPHMSLGQLLELRGSLLQDRFQFWDEIYEQHYRSPKPPPTPPHIEL